MKNKLLKLSISLVVILTMTMSNFLFVGKSLISYAQDNLATNHPNVEFKAYFKDQEGKEVTTQEQDAKSLENFLYLRVTVKKEGYFNGQVALKNANFTLKETDSQYVNKIENNTVYLNQLNVGTTEEIKIKIEPIREQSFAVGLLDMTSTIEMKGIYRDSTQKNIEIKANRDLKLTFAQNNKAQDLINHMEIITNKVVSVEGQEKRIVQIAYQMGSKENNYPMKEINAKIAIPSSDSKQAEVVQVAYLNNMASMEHQYEDGNLELTLKNEPNEQGNINWKAQGTEKVVITCLYDKDVAVAQMKISAQERVTFYNDEEIEQENSITVGQEEKDSILTLDAKTTEQSMYKGKIYSGMARAYEATTQVNINFAKAMQSLSIQEEASKYQIDEEEQKAGVTYQQTKIKKEQFDTLFGQNGVLTIYNQNEEVVGTITNETPMDQEGNLVIIYPENEVKSISIQTTNPVAEGSLTLVHEKIVKDNAEVVKNATALKNQITATYNHIEEPEVIKQLETQIKLENTITKANIYQNKESLSTVISNNVEIRAVLVSNNEKYDLYKNPQIQITMPEQVEEINLNSIDLLYENELKIKDYSVNGRTIQVTLEGEQTQYKEEVIEGATVVINAQINVNRKAATQETAIQMTYTNEKAISYEEGDIGTANTNIKIVAPTDLTTIYSVKELGIETLGQEENKQVLVPVGKEAKNLQADVEIINNSESTAQNVKVMGEFPTNNQENNMDVQVQGLKVEEQAKVYYTENEEATDDINVAQNGWTEQIENTSKVSKYLITADNLASQDSIQASYAYELPANLEYNQKAKTNYQVSYTNQETQVENSLKSTNIEMQTGIGPKVETKLTATAGGKEITEPVRNGEVIQYTIEVSNVGTEEVKQIQVTGKVPEGSTMVVPEDNYEYTGPSYYEELEERTYEATIDTLSVGQVVTKTYEVRVNNDTKSRNNLNEPSSN